MTSILLQLKHKSKKLKVKSKSKLSRFLALRFISTSDCTKSLRNTESNQAKNRGQSTESTMKVILYGTDIALVVLSRRVHYSVLLFKVCACLRRQLLSSIIDTTLDFWGSFLYTQGLVLVLNWKGLGLNLLLTFHFLLCDALTTFLRGKISGFSIISPSVLDTLFEGRSDFFSRKSNWGQNQDLPSRFSLGCNITLNSLHL